MGKCDYKGGALLADAAQNVIELILLAAYIPVHVPGPVAGHDDADDVHVPVPVSGVQA